MSDFHSQVFPKAKKPHRCDECCGTIQIGEKYQRNSGKQDGDIYDYCLCVRCAQMWAAAWDLFGWYGEDAPTLSEKQESKS